MNAGRDLLLFILFLVALGIAWFMTGGPSRPLSQAGWFLNPPAPLGNGQGYNVPMVPMPTSTQSTAQLGNTNAPSPTQSIWNYFFNYRTGVGASVAPPSSPYAQFVSLQSSGARNTNPQQEYVTLRISPRLTGTLTITGWTIESAQSGIKVTLGGAAQIPALGGVSSETPVSIGPSGTIIIVTGQSPKGASFRVNKCTGYFNQFQQFTPTLPSDCPTPQDEMLQHPELTSGNTTCQNYIQRIPQCTLVVNAIPGNVGGLCQNFILNMLSYNGCITEHQSDPDFYQNEWYLFLGRSQEMWNNSHEDIRLLDENGKLVAETSY